MDTIDPQVDLNGVGAPAQDDEGEEAASGVVVLRPDGYHWMAADGRHEFGPFATREEAMASLLQAVEEGVEPGESLEEAEQELGLANWVDTETGCLAEGLSTPHLVDEG